MAKLHVKSFNGDTVTSTWRLGFITKQSLNSLLITLMEGGFGDKMMTCLDRNKVFERRGLHYSNLMFRYGRLRYFIIHVVMTVSFFFGNFQPD